MGSYVFIICHDVFLVVLILVCLIFVCYYLFKLCLMWFLWVS